jgi:hypothetical protein
MSYSLKNKFNIDSPPGQEGWHRRGERSDPISVTGWWNEKHNTITVHFFQFYLLKLNSQPRQSRFARYRDEPPVKVNLKL